MKSHKCSKKSHIQKSQRSIQLNKYFKFKINHIHFKFSTCDSEDSKNLLKNKWKKKSESVQCAVYANTSGEECRCQRHFWNDNDENKIGYLKVKLFIFWSFLKVAISQKILENFFQCQNKYSKSLSWAENIKKLFTV